jgi:hypothetical protein
VIEIIAHQRGFQPGGYAEPELSVLLGASFAPSASLR